MLLHLAAAQGRDKSENVISVLDVLRLYSRHTLETCDDVLWGFG